MLIAWDSHEILLGFSCDPCAFCLCKDFRVLMLLHHETQHLLFISLNSCVAMHGVDGITTVNSSFLRIDWRCLPSWCTPPGSSQVDVDELAVVERVWVHHDRAVLCCWCGALVDAAVTSMFVGHWLRREALQFDRFTWVNDLVISHLLHTRSPVAMFAFTQWISSF
jgi:hypothetical protein